MRSRAQSRGSALNWLRKQDSFFFLEKRKRGKMKRNEKRKGILTISFQEKGSTGGGCCRKEGEGGEREKEGEKEKRKELVLWKGCCGKKSQKIPIENWRSRHSGKKIEKKN